MPKLSYLALASLGTLSLFSLAPANAQVLSQWTFENDSIATNNAPASSSGTGTADSIGLTNTYGTPGNSTTTDDVLQGATGDNGTNGVSDTTRVWRLRGAGGGNGWSTKAPIATQGAQFFTSTAGDTSGTIKISFDWYDTSAGEANMEFLYTTNGGTTWTNMALTAGGSDSGLQFKTNSTSSNTVMGSYVSDTSGQDWFTGLTATITDPSVLNDSGFGIEMVNASTGTDDLNAGGTIYNNSSGNWRFDNVTISEVPAAAVPEPGTWKLLLGAGIGLAAIGAFRRLGSIRD